MRRPVIGPFLLTSCSPLPSGRPERSRGPIDGEACASSKAYAFEPDPGAERETTLDEAGSPDLDVEAPTPVAAEGSTERSISGPHQTHGSVFDRRLPLEVHVG